MESRCLIRGLALCGVLCPVLAIRWYHKNLVGTRDPSDAGKENLGATPAMFR